MSVRSEALIALGGLLLTVGVIAPAIPTASLAWAIPATVLTAAAVVMAGLAVWRLATPTKESSDG